MRSLFLGQATEITQREREEEKEQSTVECAILILMCTPIYDICYVCRLAMSILILIAIIIIILPTAFVDSLLCVYAMWYAPS